MRRLKAARCISSHLEKESALRTSRLRRWRRVQGAVAALHMAGFPGPFARTAVGAVREHLRVSAPKVAAGGPAAILGRDLLAQELRCMGRVVAHEERDDLPGALEQRAIQIQRSLRLAAT